VSIIHDIPPRHDSPERTTAVAASIHELNDFWTAASSRRSMSVGGRYETRDGVRYGLGGLRWRVCDGARSMVLTTSEPECDALPNLPVVRAADPIVRPAIEASAAVAA
jgi:hypothetical protein